MVTNNGVYYKFVIRMIWKVIMTQWRIVKKNLSMTLDISIEIIVALLVGILV